MPAWLTWLKYTSWFFYGMDILMGNQWVDVKELKCNDNSTRCFPSGKAMLEFHGYDYPCDDCQSWLRDCLALLALLFGFRIVGLIALKYTCSVSSRRNGE